MTRETRLENIDAAIKAMPSVLNRADYEAICVGADIEPFTDANILTGSHRYGDYSFSDDPTGNWRIRQLASQRRESGIKAERKSVAAIAIETGKCCVCGGTFARTSLMSGSVGTVCPNDYDEE